MNVLMWQCFIIPILVPLDLLVSFMISVLIITIFLLFLF